MCLKVPALAHGPYRRGRVGESKCKAIRRTWPIDFRLIWPSWPLARRPRPPGGRAVIRHGGGAGSAAAGVADRGAVEARLGSEATVHPQAQDHRAALASLDREHAL